MSVVNERLADPEVQQSLLRLLDRAESLERSMARLNSLIESTPAVAATAVDVVDDVAARCADSGIDLDERAQVVVRLIERLSAPEVAGPLERLLARVDQFEQLSRRIDEVPGLLAMAADAFDEWVRRAAGEGIDVELAVRNAMRAGLWMSQHLDQQVYERLTELLKPDVFSEGAVAMAGDVGRALDRCHSERCRDGESPQAGLLGLLRAMRDPDVRQALGFGLHFARSFVRARRNGSAHDHQNPTEHTAPGSRIDREKERQR